jgi:beta-lactam-binding protein with PASTA domain
LCFGVKYGIDLYTHHGEKIQVPNVRHKSFADAEHILDKLGLQIAISDTGYVKTLPPDCILEQSLVPGQVVKSGRTVYVVVNASSTPTLTIPDVIDNSSYREARARLTAMGFKVGDPEYVPGERDWVYGIKCKGRLVGTGQRVPVDAYIIIQVGDGRRDLSDSVAYMEAEPVQHEETEEVIIDGDNPTGNEGGAEEVDEFEVVTSPEE